MFSPIGNRKKNILSMLFMVLLICGVIGNLSSVEAAPDLEVTNPTVYPNSVTVNGNFTLSVRVRNIGTTSPPATVIYYRSTDPTITTADTVVGTNPVPSAALVAATGLANPSIALTAPSSAATYYYGAWVVPVTEEAVTTNNITSRGADLTVTPSNAHLSVSIVPNRYSVAPNQNFNLVATVRNTGGAASSPTNLQAYQRSGSTGATIPVGNAAPVPSILGYRTATPSIYIYLSAPTTPGTYAYRVQIGDDTTKVSDWTSITVINPVDLSVDTPTADKSTVAPSGTFTLSTTVRNVGIGNFTGSTWLRYFRSADTTLNATDGTDTEVGTDPISSTLSASYGTTVEDITLTAPSEQGTYYYYAYVDPVQGEGNLYGSITDNTSPSYATVTVSAPPDLTVSVYRPRQTTFAPGERFTLDATVSNSGTGASAATQLRVYEDRDDYRREQQIDRHSVSAISANDSSSESIQLIAPREAGIYYYRVYVEPVTGETKTDNNYSEWIGIDVVEPLVLESLQASKVALNSGESFTLTATVKNDGNTRSDATTVRYYRSSNNSLSRSDTRLGSSNVSRLAAGATTQVSIPLTAPQSPGTYYYGACVGDSQTYSGDACEIIEITVVKVTIAGFQRPPMYWVDADSGALQSLTDSSVEPFVSGVQNATAVAVDAAGGKIYWTEQTSKTRGKIRSANLNGTNVRLVKELTSVPMGIALNATQGKLYITNSWGKVQSLDVNGGDFRSHVTGLDAPRGIAVDAAGGKIYWTEQPSATTGKIQSADLDGGNVRVVLRAFAGMPKGIAVDTANGKLYIANAQGQVQRLNLDGSGFQSNLIRNLNAPQGVAVDAAAGKVYWTETGKIRRANLDGTVPQNVVTGVGTPASLMIGSVPVEVLIPQSQRPPIYWQTAGGLQSLTGATVESFPQAVQNATGLAVDAAAGKVYWTEQTSKTRGKIRSANLNGTNVRVVKELTSVPMGIALDATQGKLYITNSWGKVQSLDVNGGDFRSLIKGLDAPRGIAVDAAGGKIYWTEQPSATTGKIRSANLNGKNVTSVRNLTSLPTGLAVDTVNKKLYIANGSGKIQRFNFDGTGFDSNLITGLDAPRGIAVDAAGGKIYWTARGKIQRANLNGKNVQNVVTGLGAPADIALNVPAPRNAAAAPSAAPMSPNTTALHANYPNPFNPETWIPYQLQKAADVHIAIYDQRGVLVRQLSLGYQVAGQYLSRGRAAHWDGRNQVGEPVASGLYFYTLTAGEFSATRRMLILK